jgi:uncharacterized protein
VAKARGRSGVHCVSGLASLQVDATNGIALATQVRDIEQAIELILRTAPGERPMRPEFGCRIQDHLFSPTNEATAAAIAMCGLRSKNGNPGSMSRTCGVGFDPHDLGMFYIDVGYCVRGDNDERNLVFPFYVIPDEPAALTAEQPATYALNGA